MPPFCQEAIPCQWEEIGEGMSAQIRTKKGKLWSWRGAIGINQVWKKSGALQALEHMNTAGSEGLSRAIDIAFIGLYDIKCK